MTIELINKLLLKYFDGDTSLEEENILRGYFLSDNIDAQFIKYKPLFNFLDTEKEIKISDELADKINAISIKKRPVIHVVKSYNYWWKIAAAIAFLITGTWFITKQFKAIETPQIAVNQPIKKRAKVIILDETTDPKLAFAEVEKALLLVSKNIKKGTDETTESLQKVKAATKIINQ
jgi:hypothetical protein